MQCACKVLYIAIILLKSAFKHNSIFCLWYKTKKYKIHTYVGTELDKSESQLKSSVTFI